MRIPSTMRPLGVFAALLLGAVVALGADKEGDTPLAIPLEKQQPARIGVFETAPVIDGRLDEAVWQNAAVLKDFFQIQPGDNIAPSQKTEVLIAHDRKHLYMAFRCYDTEASRVRATIPKRDNIFDDDYVGMYLDTFNDKRRAYVFFFNPLGIQADGVFTEGRGEDYSVDLVFESKGTVGPDGYTIEIAIPFESIRYEAGEGKTWGAQIFRRIKRDNNELDSWMPISRSRSGTLVQAGQLTGFEGIDTEHTLELIPSVTFSQVGKRIPAAPLPDGSYFDGTRILNRPIGTEIGLTAKYSLTPTVTLDFAANPDFAQVEADQLVVTANQRFPIFYEEKRPFFLEGIDYFQSDMNVVFTRQIVDPDAAVKLTGKVGRNTFGLLLASDNAPGNYSDEERDDPELRPSIERFLDKNAYIGVVRAKRDVGEDSSIGIFATTYNFIEDHSHLGSIDGRFRVDPKTVLSFQVAGSNTRDYFYDPELDRSEYRTGNGFGYSLTYDYTDRNFGYQVNSAGRTDDYRARVGFTRRTDTNQHNLFLRWSSDPKPNSTYIGWRATNVGGMNHDWAGRSQGWFNESQFRLNFTRSTSITVGYNVGHERLFEEEFGPKRVVDANGLVRQGAFFGPDPERSAYRNNPFTYFNSTPFRQLSVFGFVGYASGEFDYDFGAGPNYPRVSPAAIADPNAPLDPGPGRSLYVEMNATYIPTEPLRFSLAYTKSKLTRNDTDRVAFDDNIVSLRTTYQFTRFLFARARFDYDSLSARMFGQYLLGWTPNPGTAFYVGYNDDLNYNGFNPYTGVHEPGVRLNGRTFFVKMSYLIRQSI